MNNKFNLWQQACLSFFMLCQISGVYAQPPVYKVTKSVKVTSDIAVIGADPSATGLESTLTLNLLNENSDVAGIISSKRSNELFDEVSNAVRWGVRDTVPTQLGISDLGNSVSFADYETKAMNENSIIVGVEERHDRLLNNTFFTVTTRAVIWSTIDPRPTVLGSLDSSTHSEARSVNNRGIIVGSSGSMPIGFLKDRRAVRWDVNDINPIDLGVLGVNNDGEGYSIAVAVNDSGIVAGESRLYGDNVDNGLRAVRWGPNDIEPTNLGTLEGHSESVAIDINANGVIIGRSGTFAVRWDPGDTRPIKLGALSPDIGVYTGEGPYYRSISNAYVINNNNVIAGSSFLYDRSIAGGPPRFRFHQRGNGKMGCF